MKTTCSKIIIEIILNNKIEFITYENISVWEAMKKLKKNFGEVYIYGIETEY
jgi:hypothetical protein